MEVRIEVVERSSDAEAVAFFRRHYGELYRYVSRSTGFARNEIDDLVQETLVQAWRDRGQFEKAAAPLTWLIGIAKNRIRDLLRRQRVRRDSEQILRALGRLESEDLPPDLLESAELGAGVRKALQELPPEYSDLLIWRYFEERSVKAIAEKSNESEEAIESRLRRAREALRRRLGEGGDHGD